MRFVFFLTSIVFSASVFGQNMDSLRQRLAEDSVIISEWSRQTVYWDVPIVGSITTNATISFERVTRDELLRMSIVLKACKTFAPGRLYRLDSNYTHVVYYPARVPEPLPDGGIVVHPGPTIFVFSPSRQYFYVFSYNEKSRKFSFRVYFAASEKNAEVVDAWYAKAGDDPVGWIEDLVFGYIRR